jgi:hypothetical protein
MKRISFIMTAVTILMGCQSNGNTQGSQGKIDVQVAQMTDCEKLKALIQSHNKEFNSIKLRKISNKFSDVWDARYHLVGKGCQVIRWGYGNHSYACSIISPGEKAANEIYLNAKTKIESCLGDEWKLKERALYGAKGMSAVYMNNDDGTAVATHSSETNGIFKNEWTNYFFVGDRKEILE